MDINSEIISLHDLLKNHSESEINALLQEK